MVAFFLLCFSIIYGTVLYCYFLMFQFPRIVHFNLDMTENGVVQVNVSCLLLLVQDVRHSELN